jgi:ketosteroid isomerase-like protein
MDAGKSRRDLTNRHLVLLLPRLLDSMRAPCFEISHVYSYSRQLCSRKVTTATKAQVWNLEKAYWEYAKANDLEKYRGLWHEDFVGWPTSSSTPMRKDHITDWITRNTSKGVKMQSYAIEQLAIQVTGDVAIDHYRVKIGWAGPGPTESNTEVVRITHTWLRAQGSWQIIGGMSAPVNAEGK